MFRPLPKPPGGTRRQGQQGFERPAWAWKNYRGRTYRSRRLCGAERPVSRRPRWASWHSRIPKALTLGALENIKTCASRRRFRYRILPLTMMAERIHQPGPRSFVPMRARLTRFHAPRASSKRFASRTPISSFKSSTAIASKSHRTLNRIAYG